MRYGKYITIIFKSQIFFDKNFVENQRNKPKISSASADRGIIGK